MQENNKQSTTEKNQTQAGLSPLKEIMSNLKLEGKTNEKAEAIRKQYGSSLSDFEVLLITRALKELAICDNCNSYKNCPKKRNMGLKPRIHVGEEWDLPVTYGQCKPYEDYLRQEVLAKQFKYAKIPLRYRGKTFADYTADNCNQTAVDFAKSIMVEGYSGAYFYGAVGTGKTFLAALIAQEFLKAGKTVLFEKVADLLTEFYAVYRGQGGSEEAILNALYDVDLLVLDDFGIEKATQFVGATLCKILDSRYNREDVTTIITSNYPLEQIETRLNNPSDVQNGDLCLNGSRIRDRCAEICKPILFKGKSRRR